MRLATGERRSVKAGGLVVKVGKAPRTELFRDQLEIDDSDAVVVDETLATSRPGVFAAGDVVCRRLLADRHRNRAGVAGGEIRPAAPGGRAPVTGNASPMPPASEVVTRFRRWLAAQAPADDRQLVGPEGLRPTRSRRTDAATARAPPLEPGAVGARGRHPDSRRRTTPPSPGPSARSTASISSATAWPSASTPPSMPRWSSRPPPPLRPRVRPWPSTGCRCWRSAWTEPSGRPDGRERRRRLRPAAAAAERSAGRAGGGYRRPAGGRAGRPAALRPL